MSGLKKVPPDIEPKVNQISGMKEVTTKVLGDQEKEMTAAGYRAVLFPGTDDEVAITGYKLVRWRQLLVTLVMILTCGLAWLLLYWLPKFKLQLTHCVVTLEEAEAVLVEDKYASYSCFYVKNVYTNGPHQNGIEYPLPEPGGKGHRDVTTYRYFNLKKETFLWHPDLKMFYPIPGLEEGASIAFFHKQHGLTKDEQERRRLVYGLNDIIIPFHSVPYLLVKEVLNPFYIFQIFSVSLWFSDEYYYYAATIVILSAGSIALSIYQTRKNQKRLHSTVQSTDIVTVLRAGDVEETVSSEELVPGDLVVIPPGGCELNFDGVLISGTAIVNEAMLTGEAVPETKTSIPRSNPEELFNAREHQRHTVFRGTKVIQTRNYAGHRVVAVVIRTGFFTTKGQLVRSILFPAPVDFKFEQDSYKFVALLALIASIGFIYTTVRLVMKGASASEIILDAADLITIVVPPALPAAMTMGSLYAQDRLKKRGIFCISPRTINVSGSLDCVCFDKTGTLTEDGLDLLGVVPLSSDSDGQPLFDDLVRDPRKLEETNSMLQAMASCHSVTIIEEQLSGDPMDVIMFSSTGWTLDEQTDESTNQIDNIAPTVVRPPGQKAEERISSIDPTLNELVFEKEIGIIRQFQFTSERQCMSVVARGVGESHFTVFCKGSPEKIKSISLPESMPADFDTTLERYTERGYRVIAIGRRNLPEAMNYRKIQRMERVDAEKELTFLGFIIMENRIKAETKPTITKLHNAKIRTIMVTGDHIQTALSVAKECQMVKPSEKVIFITATTDDNGKPDIVYHLAKTTSNGNNNSVVEMTKMGSTDAILDLENGGANNNFNNYHFATTGKSFLVIRNHYPDILDKLFVRGTIYARMSPDEKETLVTGLQRLGYYVAMCGDGANDCGALKAAHAGISLSEAEASVASPFTSNEANISCVPRLIQEGRCALVTSFGIFKYMAAYSLTQFVSVMILYNFGTNLTDLQFLYIDLFLITVFAGCFGLTKPYEGDLAKQAPSNSLINFLPVSSLLLQIVAVILFQVFGLTLIQGEDWFLPFNEDNPTYNGTEYEKYYEETFSNPSEYPCWENYAVFTVSSFQYIILAYAFSKSAPYRKRVFTNYALFSSLIVMTAFTFFVVFYPTRPVVGVLEVFLPPPGHENFRWVLLGIILANIAICIFLEDVVVEVFFRKFHAWCRRSTRSKPEYVKINDWMKRTFSWPPLSPDPSSAADMDESDPGRSPIETQVDFEVVDESEAFNKLFPTRSSGSDAGSLVMDASSAVKALNSDTVSPAHFVPVPEDPSR